MLPFLKTTFKHFVMSASLQNNLLNYCAIVQFPVRMLVALHPDLEGILYGSTCQLCTTSTEIIRTFCYNSIKRGGFLAEVLAGSAHYPAFIKDLELSM